MRDKTTPFYEKSSFGLFGWNESGIRNLLDQNIWNERTNSRTSEEGQISIFVRDLNPVTFQENDFLGYLADQFPNGEVQLVYVRDTGKIIPSIPYHERVRVIDAADRNPGLVNFLQGYEILNVPQVGFDLLYDRINDSATMGMLCLLGGVPKLVEDNEGVGPSVSALDGI